MAHGDPCPQSSLQREAVSGSGQQVGTLKVLLSGVNASGSGIHIPSGIEMHKAHRVRTS